jgi:hypothetical protein
MPTRQIPERPAPRRPRGLVTAFLAVQSLAAFLFAAGVAGGLSHVAFRLFDAGWNLIP